MNVDNICTDINEFIKQLKPQSSITIDNKILKISPLSNHSKIENKKKYLEIYNLKRFDPQYRVEISEAAEDLIFSNLFSINSHIKIYHYTTIQSLVAILKNRTFKYSSLSGMNDSSELQYSYRSMLYKSNKVKNDVNSNKSMNDRFVLSCSLRPDDLNQWRLYGDDAKGVCLELKQKNSPDYIIGKIFYGDLFVRLFNELHYKIAIKEQSILTFKKFCVWRAFLKSNDYKEEDEIRILYQNNKVLPITVSNGWDVNRYGIFTKYITVPFTDNPFTISKVTLGPKLPHAELNRMQLQSYLRENTLSDINVFLSEKNNYR
jgi:hypothetical protein